MASPWSRDRPERSPGPPRSTLSLNTGSPEQSRRPGPHTRSGPCRRRPAVTPVRLAPSTPPAAAGALSRRVSDDRRRGLVHRRGLTGVAAGTGTASVLGVTGVVGDPAVVAHRGSAARGPEVVVGDTRNVHGPRGERLARAGGRGVQIRTLDPEGTVPPASEVSFQRRDVGDRSRRAAALVAVVMIVGALVHHRGLVGVAAGARHREVLGVTGVARDPAVGAGRTSVVTRPEAG